MHSLHRQGTGLGAELVMLGVGIPVKLAAVSSHGIWDQERAGQGWVKAQYSEETKPPGVWIIRFPWELGVGQDSSGFSRRGGS